MIPFGHPETIPMVSTDHWCRSVRACCSLLPSAPPLPLADKVVVATWMIPQFEHNSSAHSVDAGRLARRFGIVNILFVFV
jgi:hypothetical protein